MLSAFLEKLPGSESVGKHSPRRRRDQENWQVSALDRRRELGL